MEEYAIIPLSIITKGLSAREYSLLILEANLSNSKGFHWHSAESLAERLNVSIKTIYKTWGLLTSKELIKRVDNKVENRWETHICLPHTRVGSTLQRGRGLPSSGVGGYPKCGVIIREPNKEPNKEPIRKKFGEYKNVLLTQDQHSKLVSEWGEAETAKMIRILDEGIQLKGYKYKDFNLAIRQWKRREAGAAATPRNKAGPEYCKMHKTMRLENGKCGICEEEELS